MFKSALILFVAVVAIQATYIPALSRKGEILEKETELEAFKSIADEVKKLFEKLKNAVEKAAAKVKAEAEKLEAKLEEYGNEAVNKLKEELDKAVDELLQKLQDEADKHTDKDTSACVAKYRPEIQALPDQFIDEEKSCITNKINDGKNIINGVINKIKEVYQDLKNIEADIDNCGHSISCLTKLAAKLTKDIVELPLSITEAYAEAELYITTLLPSLDDCAVDKVKQLGEAGAVILAEAAACMAGL